MNSVETQAKKKFNHTHTENIKIQIKMSLSSSYKCIYLLFILRRAYACLYILQYKNQYVVWLVQMSSLLFSNSLFIIYNLIVE